MLVLFVALLVESKCDESLTGYRDEDYRGCQTKTVSGYTCQRWDSQTPHKHNYKQLYLTGIGKHNYCRNPNPDDGKKNIWCYTTDKNKNWETCDPLGKKPKWITPISRKTSWTNNLNNWKQDTLWESRKTQYLCGIRSSFTNKHEDRRFKVLKCWHPDYVGVSASLLDQTVTNDCGYYMDDHSCQCDDGSAIIKLTATYDDDEEDRIWELECGHYTGVRVTEECDWTPYTNTAGGSQYYKTKEGYVITGMKSVYNNSFDDRRYKYRFCKLHVEDQKCDKIKIKVENYEVQEEGNPEVVQGAEKTFDNCESGDELTSTLEEDLKTSVEVTNAWSITDTLAKTFGGEVSVSTQVEVETTAAAATTKWTNTFGASFNFERTKTNEKMESESTTTLDLTTLSSGISIAVQAHAKKVLTTYATKSKGSISWSGTAHCLEEDVDEHTGEITYTQLSVSSISGEWSGDAVTVHKGDFKAKDVPCPDIGPPPISDCVDNPKDAKSCATWKKGGRCTDKYQVYMKQNCRKTCEFCGEAKATCADVKSKKQKCSDYGKGRCHKWRYKTFMKKNCKKTCNLCH